MTASRAQSGPDRDLTFELIAFLDRCIRSVERLDILVLFRELPERRWTAQAVNEAMKGNLVSIKQRLHQLAGDHLLCSEGSDEAEDEICPCQ